MQRPEALDSDFALRRYTGGGVIDNSYAEDKIERISGKKLSELTEGFFTTYLTTSKLVQNENVANPWMLWEAYDVKEYTKFASNLKFDAASYKSGSTSVSVPRYGARFVRIEAESLPADADLEFSVSDEGVKLLVMTSKSFDKASVKYYKQSSSGVVSLTPTVEHIVVALINTADSEASAKLTVTPKREGSTAADKSRLDLTTRSQPLFISGTAGR